jgi:hypothetical protein
MKHEHNAMPQQLTLNNKNSTKYHYRLIGGVTCFSAKENPRHREGPLSKVPMVVPKVPLLGAKVWRDGVP